MSCIRPATPGFVVTLVATVLLAVVSFCVPYFKSVYFLRADFSVGNNNGTITFGTLGYCLELANGTTCSSPSIGYQLDINSLVGNKFSIQIPQVAVKWITYALFLHVIGLALAAISAFFGLLAHVREMSMACCSTCISGFAAGVTLIAFIFDIALFFIAKARINAVGHASIGNAIWLTLAAWLLLFFSGCFFAFGRCCIQKRGPRSKWGKREDEGETGGLDRAYAEQMRMEALKAEENRENRQANGGGGGGLPAFYETVPLTGHVEGNSVYTDKDETSDVSTPTAVNPNRPQHGVGGYVPAPHGSRAVDEYYYPTLPATTSAISYPPRPERQASHHSHATSNYNTSATPHRQQSGYTPSSTPYRNASPRTSPPPNNQFLSTSTYQDPYVASGRDYGHTAGGSSYYTAGSHQQQPSSYSQYNNYSSQAQPQNTHYSEPSFNPDVYNSTAPSSNPYTSSSTPNPYSSHTAQSPPEPYGAPQRQYTLGGDGYGANSLPPLPEESSSSYFPNLGVAASSAYPSPINTSTGYGAPSQTSPTKESYPPPPASDEAPPGYDAGTSGVTGHWSKH
ncbi:pH-response regulator protein palI/rim-9 [Leucoagaricus sp. SymC.cos]|nr:pH-response regulator protein palI/rim-9 [Leucoagaricus sp. SymC.cos]